MKNHIKAISTILVVFWIVLAISNKAAGSQSSSELTPDQVAKEHGRIFAGGQPNEIQTMLSKTAGDVYIHGGFLSTTIMQTLPRELKPTELASFQMASLMCSHDLVVLGRIGSGSSHTTNDNGFLYTDWGFLVEEVVRNNSESPVAAGKSIIVVKAGGKLQIQGRMVYAIDNNFSEFQTGQEYLLFLDFIPKTGSYAAYRPEGYEFRGDSSTQLSLDVDSYFHSSALNHLDKITLLKTARTVATTMGNSASAARCKGIRP
jgi:hypothetical protein